MTLAVEDDDGDVLDTAGERLGDSPQVVRNGCRDVDDLGRLGADDELLHVWDVRVVHGAALGQRDRRDAAGKSARHEARAVDGIDGDVDLGRAAVAHLLAYVEHRRFVLLPLADDDEPGHVDEAEAAAHGVDRRLVSCLLLVAPHEARCSQRSTLGDTHQLERQVAVDRSAEIARRLACHRGHERRRFYVRGRRPETPNAVSAPAADRTPSARAAANMASSSRSAAAQAPRNPPARASPAPVGSTTASTGCAGRSTTALAVTRAAPSGPRLTTTA